MQIAHLGSFSYIVPNTGYFEIWSFLDFCSCLCSICRKFISLCRLVEKFMKEYNNIHAHHLRGTTNRSLLFYIILFINAQCVIHPLQLRAKHIRSAVFIASVKKHFRSPIFIRVWNVYTLTKHSVSGYVVHGIAAITFSFMHSVYIT